MDKKIQAEKKQIRLNPITVSKGIGTLFILSATLIALLIQCPSKAQYLIIYTLIGIGIAFLLPKSAEKSTGTIKLSNSTIALTGAVALPFILFFINPIGSFKPDNCDLSPTTSVTVFVHGRKGKQDMILRQRGFVIMDLGAERKKASINENGQAFFQNLHIGDSIGLEIDFSEPYKTIYPDSTYVIQPDGKIYLSVSLQGIDKIKGIVLYRDFPLEGVLVKVDTLTSTTDQTGSYIISIPEFLQKEEYKVWFIKKGYKTKTTTAYPQTGQSLDVIMENNPVK